MALTERSEVDKIEILADGQIQVRRADIIERDGTEISRQFHRHVLAPGADVTNETEAVQAVAAAVWSPQVIDAYQAKLAAQQSAQSPG